MLYEQSYRILGHLELTICWIQISTVALEDKNDLACIQVHEEHDLIGIGHNLGLLFPRLNFLIAVGSQHWTTLIDRRTAIPVEQIRSVDGEWGKVSALRHLKSHSLNGQTQVFGP